MKRARKKDDEWRLTMMMGGGLGALLLVGGGGVTLPCALGCAWTDSKQDDKTRWSCQGFSSWKSRMCVDLNTQLPLCRTQIKDWRYPTSRITMNLYKAQ